MEYIFLIIFGLNNLYLFTFSIGGVFYKTRISFSNKERTSFGVLIPGYKEDSVILTTVNSAIAHNYPQSLFDIIVIADHMKKETIEELRKMKIILFTPNFESSTKVKAINHALINLKSQYDSIIILDADNLMEPNFMRYLDESFQQGAKAVQGKRSAKNSNTNIAVLDGISEAINNHIFRKGYSVLNMSCSIIGSGFGVNMHIFKDIILNMSSVGGFDRELHLKLLQRGVNVKYNSSAIILDEKVQDAKVFGNQRKRWISSQFFYLSKYWSTGWKNLIKGNLKIFNSAVLSNLILPRVLLIGFVYTFAIISFLIHQSFNLTVILWLINVGLLTITILIAIPKKMYSYKMLKAIVFIPITIFIYLKALIFSKNANKKFLHTPHNS